MRGDGQYRGLARRCSCVTRRSIAHCVLTTIAFTAGDISALCARVVDWVQLPTDGDSIHIRIKPHRRRNLYRSFVQPADVLALPGCRRRNFAAAATNKCNSRIAAFLEYVASLDAIDNMVARLAEA